MLGAGLGIWAAIDLLEGAATIIPAQNPRSDVLARVLAEPETTALLASLAKGMGGSEINKNSPCAALSVNEISLLY